MHARNILRADVGERDKTESDATHKFAVFVVQGQRAAPASLDSSGQLCCIALGGRTAGKCASPIARTIPEDGLVSRANRRRRQGQKALLIWKTYPKSNET